MIHEMMKNNGTQNLKKIQLFFQSYKIVGKRRKS